MKAKVNIYSAGRFHVLDLARELSKLGYDVKFYSFVPEKRAIFFGLPRKCSVSLLIPLLPFVILERKLFPSKKWANHLRVLVQDCLTSIVARSSDITIAMSGEFIYSIRKAKRKGSIIIVERGSKHIVDQKRILESIPSLRGKCPVPTFNFNRELECYKIADYVSVASSHVFKSFQMNGYDIKRIFKNPYGVDLSMFKVLPNVQKEYDVISVGAWSYRKGCDLIISAIKKSTLKFLHVGGINDLDFPADDERFTHIDKVDQSQLINFYNKAKVFLIPSREEGLAMVQAQAIACNLPVIGSPNSGIEDLQKIVAYPNMITVIKEYTPDAVLDAIYQGLHNYDCLNGNKYAGNAIENLTWAAYGKRYDAFLSSILNKS